MKCPICKKTMKKMSEEISSNLKLAELRKEYDKVIYQCTKDDVWVVTEIPVTKNKKSNP